MAALIAGAEVSLAYPGIRLREDVYATHGHYLDVHLTVPRMECVIASAVGRVAGIGRADFASPDDYEAALAPIYALAHSLVQRRDVGSVTRGASLSRSIYGRSGGASLAGLAIGRVAIPAAVGAINALGLGPFRSDISPVELRRAGLRAMGEVVRRLGIDAEHVIFGHTHRAGPLDGDVEGWTLPGRHAPAQHGQLASRGGVSRRPEGCAQPLFPGRVTFVGDEGPPRCATCWRTTRRRVAPLFDRSEERAHSDLWKALACSVSLLALVCAVALAATPSPARSR